MIAYNIACPECAAQPGELCREGANLLEYFHAKRLEMAAYWNEPASPVPVDDFDSAVIKTELI